MKPRATLGLAQLLQSAVDDAGMGKPVPVEAPTAEDLIRRYDSVVSSDTLRKATRKLFSGEHYARAVEEAYKCLNNAVKDKARLPTKDGADLMRDAFSPKSPTLKLSELRSSSQKDEQRGYMDVFAGAMTGIRNPRAHDHRLDDYPEVALELLTLANHLMRKLSAAKRARKNKKVP